MDARSSLARVHAFAEFDQGLEQAVLGRVNIVVGAHNFKQPGWWRRFGVRRLQHAKMVQHAPEARLAGPQGGGAHLSAAGQLGAQVSHTFASGRRRRGALRTLRHIRQVGDWCTKGTQQSDGFSQGGRV